MTNRTERIDACVFDTIPRERKMKQTVSDLGWKLNLLTLPTIFFYKTKIKLYDFNVFINAKK